MAILLRSRVLGTVEGGGVGSRGIATVRLGGEDDRVLGGGDCSAIDALRSWARAERSVGMCETMSLSAAGAGRGRVKLPMTVDHSLMGRSCDIRIMGMRVVPLALRWRSSII
jgi:hypothetical protein